MSRHAAARQIACQLTVHRDGPPHQSRPRPPLSPRREPSSPPTCSPNSNGYGPGFTPAQCSFRRIEPILPSLRLQANGGRRGVREVRGTIGTQPAADHSLPVFRTHACRSNHNSRYGVCSATIDYSPPPGARAGPAVGRNDPLHVGGSDAGPCAVATELRRSLDPAGGRGRGPDIRRRLRRGRTGLRPLAHPHQRIDGDMRPDNAADRRGRAHSERLQSAITPSIMDFRILCGVQNLVTDWGTCTRPEVPTKFSAPIERSSGDEELSLLRPPSESRASGGAIHPRMCLGCGSRGDPGQRTSRAMRSIAGRSTNHRTA